MQKCTYFALCCMLAMAAHAQEPVGIFDNHQDIGDVSSEGFGVYDGTFYSITKK